MVVRSGRRALLVFALLAVACQPAGVAQPAPSAAPTGSPDLPTSSPSAAPTARATPAPAREARCGEVLTASLLLANDLTCEKDALVAGADGITIDLGGKTLTGPGMGPQTWPQPQLDSVAVRVEGRRNVTVRNGRATAFSTGVYFKSVSGSVIEAVTSERSRYGFYIHDSDGNTVRGSTVAANIYGLHLQNANDNLVQGNQLVRQTYNSPGGYGIYLFSSSRNRIVENTIENNVNWGIWFSQAGGNLTFHNNVAGNRPQVSDNEEGNVWHDPTTKEGNFWGDYPGRDANGDGIGDSSYLILGPANVVDPYPFIERDGWKKKTTSTIDTYQPPLAAQPKDVRLIVLAGDTLYEARPSDAEARPTGIAASSLALQSDLRTVYALDGQRLAIWDISGREPIRALEVAVADGVVAANRDGRSALVVGPRGAQQIDTTTQQGELFAYAKQPRGIAPSYKHNHIFVAHDRGLDLFYLNFGGRTPYTIPLDGPAQAIAMSGSGTRVYVVVGDGTVIDVADTEQYAVVDRIRLPFAVGPIAISPREDRLYAGYRGGILAVDLADGSVVLRQEAAFLGVVMDLALSPNGDELYAALGGLDQGVAVLRTADLTRANIVRLAELPLRLVAAAY